MNKIYQSPTIRVVEFELQDFLTVSGSVGHEDPVYGGDLGDGEYDTQWE